MVAFAGDLIWADFRNDIDLLQAGGLERWVSGRMGLQITPTHCWFDYYIVKAVTERPTPSASCTVVCGIASERMRAFRPVG